MFDIGFWELILIAVVALVVIGPERLPGLARTAGKWVGRGRRFLSTVRADIERELKADELKRILEEQAKSDSLDEIVEETKSAFKEIDDAGESLKSDLEAGKAKNRGSSSETDKGAHG
jgi:sec-independent protein translocase protein TatB